MSLRLFFRAPAKALLLLVGGAGLALASAPAPLTAQDQPLIADLRQGGEALFEAVVPSILQVTNRGAGSGYVIDKAGYAITNFHVTQRNESFEVAFRGNERDRQRYKAVLVGEDPALDMALIQVVAPAEKIVPLKLADPAQIAIGDTVATIGSPAGAAGSTNPADIREGLLDFFNFNLGTLKEIIEMEDALVYYSIQAQGAEFLAPDYATAVQYMFHVDAAINPGNSGGPCVNARGEAIGTNTWGYGGVAGYENFGLTVPAGLLQRSARELLQYGRVKRPWLGIALHDPDPPKDWYADSTNQLAESAGSWIESEPERMVITVVNSYSPAAEQLKVGDQLLALDGVEYDNIFEVYRYLLNKQVGDKVTLLVERRAMSLPPITITLAEKRNRYDAVRIDNMGGGTAGRFGGARIFQITY